MSQCCKYCVDFLIYDIVYNIHVCVYINYKHCMLYMHIYTNIHTLLYSQSQYLAANLTPNAEIAVF